MWPSLWRPRLCAHAALLSIVSLLAACDDSPTSPTTALSLSCPASFEVQSRDGRPLVVTYPPPLPLGGAAPVSVTCTPPSGSVFPVRTTAVTCTATDAKQATASCGFTVTVTPPPYLRYTRFLAFGDSLTEGQDGIAAPTGTGGYVPLVVRPEIAYPTRLQEKLIARYVAQTPQVINRGVGGERATTGVNRLPTEITSVRPEVVLLLEGANDIAGGNAAGLTPAANALRTMVRDTRSRGLPVFLATLPPQDPTRPRGSGAALVVPLNDLIRRIALEEGAVLVDLFAAFNGDLTLLGPDGLHPNEAGYLRMADTFLLVIRERLETPFPGVTAGAAASLPSSPGGVP